MRDCNGSGEGRVTEMPARMRIDREFVTGVLRVCYELSAMSYKWKS